MRASFEFRGRRRPIRDRRPRRRYLSVLEPFAASSEGVRQAYIVALFAACVLGFGIKGGWMQVKEA